ncbi:MAG: HYR domain-containing protein, partial [Bacteroidota bacterium]
INSAGRLENNNGLNNSGSIHLEICAILVQNANNGIGGNIFSDGLIYEINGPVNETNLEFGLVFNDINDTPAPVPACKGGVFFQLDESGIVNFTAEDIDQGNSYGSCGAQLVDISVTPTSFTAADAGVSIVTLSITDENGVTSTCEDFVTIIPFQEPLHPVDDEDITATCPEEVEVATLPGAPFAEVSWTAPEASSNCIVGTQDCSNAPSIDGMMYLGTFGNAHYYKKPDGDLPFADALAFVQARGGNLPIINDAEENAFLTNAVAGQFWLALTDEAQEGNFQWIGGNSSYTNWGNGEPNNYGNGEDYAHAWANGQWNDASATAIKWAVMELPCSNGGQPDCAKISNSIGNLIYLGEFNDSKYYCSNTNNYTWLQARAEAEAFGGHLAIINDAAENEFIRSNILADYVWLGLTDEAQEGTFRTVFGDLAPYLNWKSGEPNNAGGSEDYVRLLRSNGQWTDRNEHFTAEYVVEIPCPAAPLTPTPQVCSLADHGPSGNGIGERLVWIDFDDDPTNREYTVTSAGASFEEFANGTARLTGVVERVDNANRKWAFTVNLINKRDWSAWSALGRSFKSNNAIEGEDHTTWTYYELDNNNSTFEGLGANAGKTLQITHAPSDYEFGFQVGFGANLKDGDFGISGWFDLAGSKSGHGDFNGDLNACVPNSNNGEVSIVQIQGIENGGNFPVGTTQIGYRITDDCGNEEICLFDVVVEGTPSELTLSNCPQDIIVETLPCEDTAIVDWDLPTVTSTCYIDDIIFDRVDSNPESGAAFPIGNAVVSYIVADSCGNAEVCSFNVIVNEKLAALEVNCSQDINEATIGTSTNAIISWDAPTGISGSTSGAVEVTQLSGPESGSLFEIGTYTVLYLLSDDCNNTELCSFNITLSSGCFEQSCDDGDACTINDQFDENCNCQGTFIDTDGDGVCNVDDCDDNDPNLPAIEGTACNDGNMNTENDVIGADGCSCSGTLIDADGDGSPITEDCDDTDPSIPADPGTACDDGDATTANDVIGADGCSCGGELIDADGDGIPVTEDCDDTDPNLPTDPGIACDDDNLNTINDVIAADGCTCEGTPASVNGGELTTEDPTTICAGDGLADPINVELTGAEGSNT